MTLSWEICPILIHKTIWCHIIVGKSKYWRDILETFRPASCSQRAKYSIKGSETDCRSVEATAISRNCSSVRVGLTARLTAACPPIYCYCNCTQTQTYSFAPPPSLINRELFEHSTLMSDFGGVLLGGDLLGRRRGVIEVTKRGEVNIPGIPGCCCC